MNSSKITRRLLEYPSGLEPDHSVPVEYAGHRFVLGRVGKNPLIAICMNPSAANLTSSDSTVNKVAKASVDLGYRGWFIVNIYPERATKAQAMDPLEEELINQNVAAIRRLLREYGVKEVWGAWGELKHPNLTAGLKDLLEMLTKEGIKVFAFHVNKSGNPKHPLYLKIDPANWVEVDVSRLLHSIS